METIGSRIGYWRTIRNMTQTELARKMRQRGHTTIRQTRQSEIELGTREVTAVELVSYARLLHVPITTLLGEPDFVEDKTPE